MLIFEYTLTEVHFFKTFFSTYFWLTSSLKVPVFLIFLFPLVANVINLALLASLKGRLSPTFLRIIFNTLKFKLLDNLLYNFNSLNRSILLRYQGIHMECSFCSFKKVSSITYRTVTLDQATDSAKIIGRAALNMFHTMKLNISDMRGVSSNILKQDFL